MLNTAHKFYIPLGVVPMPEPPTEPIVGETYYDTNLKKLRTWTGTEWINAAPGPPGTLGSPAWIPDATVTGYNWLPNTLTANDTNGGTLAHPKGILRLIPIVVPYPMKTDGFGYELSANAATGIPMHLGLYQSDPLNHGKPFGAPICSTTVPDNAAAGIKEALFTPACPLEPGTYWCAFMLEPTASKSLTLRLAATNAAIAAAGGINTIKDPGLTSGYLEATTPTGTELPDLTDHTFTPVADRLGYAFRIRRAED